MNGASETCERSFAIPVECIWHRLIELGTKNYWNCQKNWSLTIKQKSIHCMKKVLEIFFSRPIKFLSSANIFFFSWMRFFLFSLWSSIFAVIDRRLQKRNPGCVHSVLFLWFGFSWENEWKQRFLVFSDYYTRSWDRFIVVNSLFVDFPVRHSPLGVENVFFTNSINFHSSFKFFTFFFLVKIAKLFFAMWRNCQTHPRYKNIQNTNRCFWLFSCDCFWLLSRPAFNTC